MYAFFAQTSASPQDLAYFLALKLTVRGLILTFLAGLGGFDSALADVQDGKNDNTSPRRMYSQMVWQPEQELFVGVSYFINERPLVKKIGFILFPNAYIRPKLGDRKKFESFAPGFSGEDVNTLLNNGSILVNEVSVASAGSHSRCRSLQSFQNVAQDDIDWQDAHHLWNSEETALAVDWKVEDDASCQILRLQYEVSIPRTAGNVGLAEKTFHWSGPVAPLPSQEIYSSTIDWRGVPLACSSCVQIPNGARQVFAEYPDPVHGTIDSRPLLFSSQELGDYLTWELDARGSGHEFADARLRDEIKFALESLVAHFPSLKTVLFSSTPDHGPPYRLTIVFNILKDKLVFAQQNELQLGVALFKTNPFFHKYHRAALMRELLVLLLEEKLRRQSRPQILNDVRLLRTAARLLAEQALPRMIPGLADLERFSSALSFLPLFDEIARGTALQNNEALLGRPEGFDWLDTRSSDWLLPGYTGPQLLQRLEFCFEDPVKGNILKTLEQWLAGESAQDSEIQRMKVTLANFGSETCQNSALEILSADAVAEAFEVRLLEGSNDSWEMEFRRTSLDSAPHFVFLDSELNASQQIKDTPRVSLIAKKDDVLFDRYWTSDLPKSIVIAGQAEQRPVRAEIQGPTLGSDSDQHVYPRSMRFYLSGLQIALRSAEQLARLDTGVLVRQLGDDFGRRFEVGLAAEVRYGEQSESAFELGSRFLLNLAPVFEDPADGEEPGLPFGLPFWFGIETETGEQDEFPQVFAALGLGIGRSSGGTVTPVGWALNYRVRRAVWVSQNRFEELNHRFSGSWDQPIGRLSTFRLALSYGSSTFGQELRDFVPGVRTDLVAHDYLASRTQVQSSVLGRLNVDLLGLLLFEDLLVFGAHHAAFPTRSAFRADLLQSTVQSFEFGLQIVGAFMGSKDQSLALSVLRDVTAEPSNSFALTIGRN